MKSVLISIQPRWCELIASGKKTVEVRKTKPRLETPFKVYIYCTKKKKEDEYGKTLVFYEDDNGVCEENGKRFSPLETGKVIGDFVCDKIYDIKPHYDIPIFCDQYLCDWKWGEGTVCLSFTEMNEYFKGKKGYGWHISDLVIYDEPRELSEFRTPEWFRDCEKQCDNMERMRCPTKDSHKVDKMCGWCRKGGNPITRPPQSWCYVESEDTE